MNEHARMFLQTLEPWKFLGVFLAVFFLVAVFLFTIDFVPEAPAPKTPELPASHNAAALSPNAPRVQASSSRTESAARFPEESPVRITASSVGIDTPVGNPASTNYNVLDNALLSGAVRYPQSGLLGENARMYLFGHQSYLPVVHNEAYKAFNGLQKLKAGDEIIVYSPSAAYHYRVSAVTHTTAEAGVVELGSGARTLTLSTCDVFGAKTDRTVVTAEFVSRTPLETALYGTSGRAAFSLAHIP